MGLPSGTNSTVNYDYKWAQGVSPIAHTLTKPHVQNPNACDTCTCICNN